MSEKTAEERVIAMLEAFFNARQIEISPQGLKLWIAGLVGMTVEQIQRGIIEFTRESTGFPTPAAIRQAAGASHKDCAELAWMDLMDAMKRANGRGINFDDKYIHAAVRSLGGLYQLGSTDMKDMGFRKRDFVDAYVAASRAGRTIGTHALGNDPCCNAEPLLEYTTGRGIQNALEYTPPPCKPGLLTHEIVEGVAERMKV